DELTKGMAESVTRRAALKKFGVGLAGMALACFGLANQAHAGKRCSSNADCTSGEVCCNGGCMDDGGAFCGPNNQCCCYPLSDKKRYCRTALPPCNPNYQYCASICSMPCVRI